MHDRLTSTISSDVVCHVRPDERISRAHGRMAYGAGRARSLQVCLDSTRRFMNAFVIFVTFVVESSGHPQLNAASATSEAMRAAD